MKTWNELNKNLFEKAPKQMDQSTLLQIYNKLRPKQEIEIAFDSAMASSDGYVTRIVGRKTRSKKYGVEKISLLNPKNPKAVKYYLYNRDGKISLALGDMGATLTDIKESIEEGFKASQLQQLKKEYSKIKTIDPEGETYPKLMKLLGSLKKPELIQIADAGIKFMSSLARNELQRKYGMKENVDEKVMGRVPSKMAKYGIHAIVAQRSKKKSGHYDVFIQKDDESKKNKSKTYVLKTFDNRDDAEKYRDELRDDPKIAIDKINEAVATSKTFKFPNDRKAKQFAYDVSNSGVAKAFVSGIRVEVEMLPTGSLATANKTIASFMKKSKGIMEGYSDPSMLTKKKKKKDEDVEEDIANVQANIAGAKDGDMPPVSKKAQKRYTKMNKRKKELEKLAGSKVFEVSTDEFAKCIKGRKKFERWERYFNTESENGKKIKSYSLRNPNSPIIIKDSKTGDMMFLRRRMNDQRLGHNRKLREKKRSAAFKRTGARWPEVERIIDLD